MSLVDLCAPLIYIGDTPFCHLLTRICVPVKVFMVVSGYGLYIVNSKGDKHRWSRIAKLYIHYWIILAVFLCIGCFINPEKYPGNPLAFVENITGLHPTYNGEMWFLLPFSIVSVSSIFLVRLIDKINKWYVSFILIFVISTFAAWCMPRGLFGINKYRIMWVIANAITFLLPMTFGALAAKHHFFEKCKSISLLQNYPLLLFTLLLTFQLACPKIPFFDFWLVTGIVLVFHKYRNQQLSNIFISLGESSMDMWMIHSWFCYHLFTNFIYGFKYPILIFIVLTAISYILSRLFNRICTPIVNVALNKF
jgi:hypothetical protein